MHCPLFDQQRCFSCSSISQPYSVQIEQKDHVIKTLFPMVQPQQWLMPVTSNAIACRNKAKMVVLGAAHQPLLGIINANDEAVSLVQCPLYPEDMRHLLAELENWIRISGIPPYNIAKKRGELKFILLTRSAHNAQFMLRFVVKSHAAIERIESNLSRLCVQFPAIKVVSVNIQPIHMARLEGEEELFLTQQRYLQEQFNHVPLSIKPKSFFQTNPQVAEKLYATAREWISEIKSTVIEPFEMWDLFCGVGGFALHCADIVEKVIGIEIEAEAIACAQHSAMLMGIHNIEFSALDSTDFSMRHDKAPHLVLVNPPRRGIGQTLCQQLNLFAPNFIIYSSCNPITLASDLAHLSGYKIEKAQWFDMFPHTEHAEMMVLLKYQAVNHV